MTAWSCASVVGVDKDYVPFESAGSGGRLQDASTSDVIVKPDGNVHDASEPRDASDAATSCRATGCSGGQKCCASRVPDQTGDICVSALPIVGCSQDTCDPCPNPRNGNGIAVCSDTGCAIACNPGYTQDGDSCLYVGGGGTGGGGTGGSGGGGTGGTSGSGGSGTCDVRQCPTQCIPFVAPFPCCRYDDECGCTWFKVGGVGYCF